MELSNKLPHFSSFDLMVLVFMTVWTWLDQSQQPCWLFSAETIRSASFPTTIHSMIRAGLEIKLQQITSNGLVISLSHCILWQKYQFIFHTDRIMTRLVHREAHISVHCFCISSRSIQTTDDRNICILQVLQKTT